MGKTLEAYHGRERVLAIYGICEWQKISRRSVASVLKSSQHFYENSDRSRIENKLFDETVIYLDKIVKRGHV